MTRVVSLLGVVLLGCGSGGGFPDAKPKDDSNDPPPGTFRVNWSLVDAADATLTCDQISALSVTGVMRSTGIAGGSTQVFSCGALNGASQAVIPGTWNIDWELSGGAGVIATAPRSTNVVIESGQATQLPPLKFVVDATGGLDLKISANKPGGNCGLVGANGAGIDGMTITLESEPDNTCEPITLNIAAGATRPASTYTINCATPVVAGCIESDQAITTAMPDGDIPSGPYQIHIRGTVGANTCFQNDDMFPVPAGDFDARRTFNLGPTGAPGC